ncbi:MAG: hypothetical protein ACYCWW_15140 [Deltaproteobacteria bacterium]
MDAAGKPLFTGHLAFSDGPLRLCAVALSPKGDYGPGVVREEPLPAAKRELSALAGEPCDAKLLLADLTSGDLEALLKENPGFDLVAQAHDGWQSDPQPIDGVPVVHVGQRGRVVERLELSVVRPGSGPFVDVGAKERLKAEIGQMDGQIQAVKKEIDRAAAAQVKPLRARLELIERRRSELSSQAEIRGTPSRTLRASYVTLDPKVADDPGLLKRVEAHLAKYPEPAAPMPARFAGGGPGHPFLPHPLGPAVAGAGAPAPHPPAR